MDAERRGAGLFQVTAWHGDLGDLRARIRSTPDVLLVDEAVAAVSGRRAVEESLRDWLDAFAAAARDRPSEAGRSGERKEG